MVRIPTVSICTDIHYAKSLNFPTAEADKLVICGLILNINVMKVMISLCDLKCMITVAEVAAA
jgi:hypothetical protein